MTRRSKAPAAAPPNHAAASGQRGAAAAVTSATNHCSPISSSSSTSNSEGDGVRVCSSVTIAQHPTFGKAAVALRDFRAGDVVIEEPPLLHVVGIDDLLRDYAQHSSRDSMGAASFRREASMRCAKRLLDVCRRHRVPPRLFEPALSIILTTDLSTERVVQLERDMCTPSMEYPKAERLAAQDLLAVEGASDADASSFEALVPQWCTSREYWNALRQEGTAGCRRLLAFMHAIRINTHEAGDDLRFVFATASKLAHSCDANTLWELIPDDTNGGGVGSRAINMNERGSPRWKVRHVATRNVCAGDLITFSYLGTGVNMLLPTLFRREQIGDLGFVCGCDRCRRWEVDGETCRSLRCLSCKVPECVRLGGGGWRCDVCGEAFHAPLAMSQVLFDEQVLRTLVMQLFFASASSSTDGTGSAATDEPAKWRCVAMSAIGDVVGDIRHPLVRRWAVVSRCAESLGLRHALTIISVHGLLTSLVKAAGLSCTKPPTPQSRDLATFSDCVPGWMGAVHGYVEAANRWFTEEMAGESPQHLRMVLLAWELSLLLRDIGESVSGGMDGDSDRVSALCDAARAALRPSAALLRLHEFRPLVLPSWPSLVTQ